MPIVSVPNYVVYKELLEEFCRTHSRGVQRAGNLAEGWCATTATKDRELQVLYRWPWGGLNGEGLG